MAEHRDEDPHLCNIEDLVTAVRSVVGEFGEVWWRGQPSGRALLPKAYRDGGTHRMEWLRITRFMQKAATRQTQVPGPEEYMQWLFLMQHHGLPTRLLDWTESPLIASLFGVLDKTDTSASLWALSPFWLNKQQLQQMNMAAGTNLVSTLPQHNHQGGITYLEASDLIEPAFRENETIVREYERVVAILTPETNVRMLQQQSVFTVHGTKTPLNLLEGQEQFLRHFVIPKEAKITFRKDLQWLGIRESTLFPDLDHLAGEICRTIGTTS